MILAPPASLSIAEGVALHVHSGPIGTLSRAESPQGSVALGHGENSSLLHGALLIGCLDSCGGSTTLQNRPHLDFLGGDLLMKGDPLLELVGTVSERPEGRLLFLAHRLGGSVALDGLNLGHGLHLGDNSSQFVEKQLDLGDLFHV